MHCQPCCCHSTPQAVRPPVKLSILLAVLDVIAQGIVVFSHQNLAGPAGALLFAYDAQVFEGVHQPSRPRVADTELALNERRGEGPRFV